MVRKRPSPSTSARPIGSMSSKRLEMRRTRHRQRVRTVEQVEVAEVGGPWRIERNEHGAELPPGFAFGDQLEMTAIRRSRSTKSREARQLVAPSPTKRALREQAGCKQRSCPAGRRTLRARPRAAEQLAGPSSKAVGSHGERIGRSRLEETPEQQIALATDALDLDWDGARGSFDAGDASRTVAPCHRLRELEPFARLIVRCQSQWRPRITEAFAIGCVDEEQRAFACR